MLLLEGYLAETGMPVRVEIGDDRVASVRPLASAPNLWIAPGFLDIQVNGYAGHNVNAAEVSPEDVAGLVRALWRRGVAAICPTVVTQSEERICRSLRAIAGACEADALLAHAIPCIHVEGPHISSEEGPRGAHQARYIRPPNLEEYRRWQQAAGGRVGLITLAPEQPGAIEYIRAVTADGVVAAIGHTAAGGEQIRAAVDAGARLSTHLGNGAHAQLNRHHNYIWEQLAEDRLMASLICDGHHLPPAVVKSMLRAKGTERSILVSDADALAGLPPGTYRGATGAMVELLPTGRLNLLGTPYLAGSTSALPECVAAAVRLADLPLSEAVRLASLNPARLLGLDERRGRIVAGAAADVTLFALDHAGGGLTVERTIVAGRVVYEASTAAGS